ncbi:MAG: hypothetical protein L3J46_10570 [Kangiellaceae bacterium]|nr:hypothetical protein [Kangiellaceae bacterium]
MGRKEGFNGAEKILEILANADRPLSMREIQRMAGVNWNTVWYWLRDQKNKRNLVVNGCVVEMRKKDYTLNKAQDQFVYALSKFGRKFCLQNAKEISTHSEEDSSP